jgi:phospholipid-translocating ATPase
MIISNIASALVYVGVIFAFPKQLLVSDMTPKFFGYVILIVSISWGPLFLAGLVLKKLDPSDFEKIMKNVKRQKVNMQIFK